MTNFFSTKVKIKINYKYEIPTWKKYTYILKEKNLNQLYLLLRIVKFFFSH